MALGDVDGDGDLDLVAGDWGQVNRLYLNDGVDDPFDWLGGSDVTIDTHNTESVALGDVDVDGDLDIVAGNVCQPGRLYLNNGTSSLPSDKCLEQFVVAALKVVNLFLRKPGLPIRHPLCVHRKTS